MLLMMAYIAGLVATVDTSIDGGAVVDDASVVVVVVVVWMRE